MVAGGALAVVGASDVGEDLVVAGPGTVVLGPGYLGLVDLP